MMQQKTFYSHPNRSGSTSNLTFGRTGGGNNDTSSKMTQEPSFSAASSSSLPGALGLNSFMTADYTAPGWTMSDTTSSPDIAGHRARPGTVDSEPEGARRLRSRSNQHSTAGDFYQMPSNSSGSLLLDGLSSRSTSQADRSTQRTARPSTADASAAASLGNHSRNFLIPIGATGARQKLSVLSASQRPKTAQSAGHAQRPTADNHTNTASVSAQEASQHGGSFQTSADPISAQGNRSNGSRPSHGGRSMSASSNSLLNSSSSKVDQGWPAHGGSSSRLFQSGPDNTYGDQWRASGSTTTREAKDPMMARKASQDSLQESYRFVKPTSTLQAQHSQHFSPISENSAAIPPRPGSRSGAMLTQFGRRLTSRDGAMSGNGMSNGQSTTADNPPSASSPASRTTESSRQKQLTRPSSSAGRERAAKLGAGFKSMFSSKAGKDGPASRTDQLDPASPPATYSKSHIQSTGHTASRDSAPRDRADGRAGGRSRADSQPLSRPIVPPAAESAGWMAFPESSTRPAPSRIYTSPIQQPSSRLYTGSTASDASTYNNEREQSARLRGTSGLAPSIELNLPSSHGLFGNSSAERLLSFDSNETRDIGKDSSQRQTGTAIPDKSLPPTPDLRSNSSTTSLKGSLNVNNGRTTQSRADRVDAQSSAWSQSTLHTSGSHLPDNIDASWNGPATPKASQRRVSGATSVSDAEAAPSEGYGSPYTRAGSSVQSHTSSTEDKKFSAPNSSRSWSPAASQGPIVPITSPLLASVLSKQQDGTSSYRSSQTSLDSTASPQSSPLSRRNVTASSVHTNGSTAEEVHSPSSLVRDTSAPVPTFRPDLPVKSRERSTTLQPDPATLAKLERGVSSLSDDRGRTPSGARKLSEKQDSASSAGSSGKTKSVQDPSTHVPANALTFTRKGTPVRPSTVKENPLAEGDSEAHETSSSLLSTQKSTAMDSNGRHRATRADEHAANTGQATSTDSNYLKSLEGKDDITEAETSSSTDAVNLLPSSAWAEVQAALGKFKAIGSPNSSTMDKGGLLRSVLLPFLALEAETPNVEVSGVGPFQSGKSRRGLFFKWIEQLLHELQSVQTSADRGAILESIACMIESRNFSVAMIQTNEEDEKRFYSVFGHILNYAIGELNKKGVYQNTLIFSGRLLAVAFFRVEGVASKLLRALPVNRFALERIAMEVDWSRNVPQDWDAFTGLFPPSLHHLCFQEARSYLKELESMVVGKIVESSDDTAAAEEEDHDRYLVRQPEVEVEMSGNWLRRWQSDDSELFFSFCRSYHRQLAGILSQSSRKAIAASGQSHIFFGGPGYAHLATCIHQKCLSLVHREILSVTTLSSQKNFNPGETANVLSGSTAGKPRHLEAANRRCTAIVVDIVRSPSASISYDIFGPILGIHIKCLIRRTSLYDVQGVFCLLDWLDGVLSHMENAELPPEKLIDVEFIVQTVWMLLRDADHALALMRTIAFCYSNFAVLTSTSKNRTKFCEEILLHPRIFQKLFLSWSFTIRAYFLHLLVFRLARINDFAHPEDDSKGKTSIQIARLFNQRLDEIRKRHDELSPTASADSNGSDDDEDEGERSKRRPQSFVSTIKRTSSVHKVELSPSAMTKAEKVLGIGMPDPTMAVKSESGKSQSKAAKWLRALGGKGGSTTSLAKASLKKTEGGSPYLADSAHLDMAAFSSPGSMHDSPHSRSSKKMPKVDEVDGWDDSDDAGGDEEDEDDHTDAMRGYHGSSFEARRRISAGQQADDFEFSFEPRAGHDETSSSQVAASIGDLTPKKHGAMLPHQGHQEEDRGLANDHISPSVSFDLQNPSMHASALMDASSGLGGAVSSSSATTQINSSGAKLGAPAAARISRAFSKRKSILPSPAADLVHQTSTEWGSEEDVLSPAARRCKERRETTKAEPYNARLHIYAVQSLREYEQTVQEHDEFFNSQADASNPQVPRLPIQWPAMWTE